MNSIRCDICNLFYPEEEMVSGRGIPKEIETLLKEKNSLWDDSCNVCPKDYNQARIAYVKKSDGRRSRQYRIPRARSIQ